MLDIVQHIAPKPTQVRPSAGHCPVGSLLDIIWQKCSWVGSLLDIIGQMCSYVGSLLDIIRQMCSWVGSLLDIIRQMCFLSQELGGCNLANKFLS